VVVNGLHGEESRLGKEKGSWAAGKEKTGWSGLWLGNWPKRG
jgi:hypothetical protein